MFSDILIPVEAMGAQVGFTEKGPQLAQPLRSIADVDRLRIPDPATDMLFALETLSRLRTELNEEAALIGFCGAPLTLAAYLIEGSGSKNFSALKTLLYKEPSTLHALLAKLADTLAGYAAAQVAAGAQAIQVFDTWAGELAPDVFERFALPYQTVVVERIRSAGVPAILYVNGCAGVLELMARTNADVLSVDWRIGLDAVRERVGESFALQGNVDPAVLLATPETVRTAASDAVRAAGPVGHILNLGHGILPATPLECASAFVDSVRMAPAAIRP
jgi:uroporphyrinogen decarboxylase